MANEIPMIALQGGVMIEGQVLKSIQKFDLSDSYLVDAKVLSEMIETGQRYEALEKKYAALEASSTHLTNAVRSGGFGASGTILELETQVDSLKKQLQEAREKVLSLQLENQKLSEAVKESTQRQDGLSPADHSKYLNRLSVESRNRKKKQATAVALSMELRGKWTQEIIEVLDNRGFGSSAAYVSKLLSVKDAGDKERLKDAMNNFPEEFEGLTSDDFEHWFTAKHKKAMLSAEKKRITKAVKEALQANNWGE